MKKFIYLGVILCLFLSLLLSGCGGGSNGGNNGGNNTTIPAVPGGLKITAADQQLTVTWSAVPGATSYEVWTSSTNDSSTAKKYNGDETDLSCIITGLTDGNTYYIWVKAKNSVGTSDFSKVISGIPNLAVAVPNAPGAPTLTAGNTKLTVTWAPVTGAVTYEIWYGTTDNTSAAINKANGISELTYDITSLSNTVTYYVWLKATNGLGTSGFGPSSHETPGAPPAAPSKPTLTVGNEQITVTWSSVSTATGYEVWYSTTDNSSTATKYAGDSDESDLTCTITGLTDFTIYYIWVKAKNSKGISDFGTEASGSPWYTLNFSMCNVPGAASFPASDSTHPQTVNYAYQMSATPITYEQWYYVYTWAIKNGYKFAHPGREGSGGTDGAKPTANKLHPVTCVDWLDAVTWCNALTEYYNKQNNTSLACVYRYTGTVIRDSTNKTYFSNVSPYQNNGFRLPIKYEWDLAGKYIGPTKPTVDPLKSQVTYESGAYWTPFNYAAGATDSTSNSDATGAVSWCNYNSGGTTQPVGTKNPTTLGLYDICGNVTVFCFDYEVTTDSTTKSVRGGSWNDRPDNVGFNTTRWITSWDHCDNTTGFRIVRTP